METDGVPTEALFLSEVPRFLMEQYGFSVTRQTVFGWAKHGVKGERLRVVQTPGGMQTGPAWVVDFLARVEAKG